MNYKDIVIIGLDPSAPTDIEIVNAIRRYRNMELAETDWTQLPDAPVDKVAWAAYRQELRDLPAQNEDPKLIVFPERP